MFGLFALGQTDPFERYVIVLPVGWIQQNLGQDAAGYAFGPFPVVVVEEVARHGAAYEIGHTYGLCDEYNATTWSSQNNPFPGITNQCPNGDENDDEILDDECIVQPGINGCMATSFKELSNQPDNFILRNFMGSASVPLTRWVSNGSYNHLLSEFSHTSPEFSNQRLLVTGTFNKSSNITEFGNFYVLPAGSVINESEFVEGNFTIETKDNQSNTLFNFSFNLSFELHYMGGQTVDLDTAPFSFVIPFNSSVYGILFKENQTTKDEVNVTSNTPSINISFPIGDELFSNRFNISWVASDPDGDNLSYAILFSTDNGTSFSALTINYNQTSIEIDSTNISDCIESCKIRILATDGVNTANATSNSFSLENNLNISSLRTVYSNLTERVFEIAINNSLQMSISNISWSLDSGDGVVSSSFSIGLDPSEKILLFAYHNYSATGVFNLTFSAFTGLYSEKETLTINI